MRQHENSNEPLIKGAVSLPLSSSARRGKMVFGGADDDVDVCLTCSLPPDKCSGSDHCYLKHKKI